MSVGNNNKYAYKTFDISNENHYCDLWWWWWLWWSWWWFISGGHLGAKRCFTLGAPNYTTSHSNSKVIVSDNIKRKLVAEYCLSYLLFIITGKYVNLASQVFFFGQVAFYYFWHLFGVFFVQFEAFVPSSFVPSSPSHLPLSWPGPFPLDPPPNRSDCLPPGLHLIWEY